MHYSDVKIQVGLYNRTKLGKAVLILKLLFLEIFEDGLYTSPQQGVRQCEAIAERGYFPEWTSPSKRATGEGRAKSFWMDFSKLALYYTILSQKVPSNSMQGTSSSKL